MITVAAVAAIGAMLMASSSASAASFDCSVPLDNFNRADSATLGTNWTERAATMKVEGNAATNPNTTPGLATWNSVVPTQQACVDVNDNGAGTQYAAIDLGYSDNTNNAFVKVQHNSAIGFDTAYFYYGNNGSCKITGGCSFPIIPFHAARLHASLNPASGQVALDIDTNFDNAPEQTIVKTYNTPFTFGNAIGIGDYGHAFIDNFATSAAPAPPPVPTTPNPPNTKVVKAKISAKAGTAKFTFKAVGETAIKFECAFAKKPNKLSFKRCTSPRTYNNLGTGKYTFKVRAVGVGGADSSPVIKKFKING
ncbi:MAG: hypothetical protein U0R26_10265 [Solirubrobacterales bacterium]